MRPQKKLCSWNKLIQVYQWHEARDQCTNHEFKVFNQCAKTVNLAWKWINETSEPLLPPRVAEMRMWVPYFLMIVSMNCWVVGLRPSKRTLRWNSGMSGTGFRMRSLLSIAVFLTFQRANSLMDYKRNKCSQWNYSVYANKAVLITEAIH